MRGGRTRGLLLSDGLDLWWLSSGIISWTAGGSNVVSCESAGATIDDGIGIGIGTTIGINGGAGVSVGVDGGAGSAGEARALVTRRGEGGFWKGGKTSPHSGRDARSV